MHMGLYLLLPLGRVVTAKLAQVSVEKSHTRFWILSLLFYMSSAVKMDV
jgi:hypothetical protein